MKRPIFAAALLVVWATSGVAWAHIEAQYTLGRVASEATNILIIEVTRINKEKNLVICKKVRDLKGKHAGEEIKQNIGQRGEPGDSKAVMDWAEVGRQAVFFYNESGSLTCIGPHWYQAFKEGDWWAMSHAEIYMTRTYFGDVNKLFPAVEELVAGKEVVIPCMADGPREALVKKAGKVHTMKASLKLIDYNPKRDVVAVLGDASSVAAAASGREQKTLLAAGSNGWKITAAAGVKAAEPQWRATNFDDKKWTAAKTPVGYGEPEINTRTGTTIKEQGQAMLLRRTIDIPSDLLARKDLKFELRIASDDSAAVSVNGKLIADEPTGDHEFSYWNQTVSLPGNAFQPGPNTIAVLVRNTAKSSDLYFDLELSAEYKKVEKK
jgi:hypothetical protein